MTTPYSIGKNVVKAKIEGNINKLKPNKANKGCTHKYSLQPNPKAIPRQLLNYIKYDEKSTTLRKILLLTCVDQLGANDYSSLNQKKLGRSSLSRSSMI